MDETTAITKTVIVGFIVVGAFLYRVRTWKTPGFYASIYLNAIVFVSFAIGLILAGSMDIKTTNMSFTVGMEIIFACAPVALAFYYFSTRRQIRISRVLGMAFLWYVFVATALEANEPFLWVGLQSGVLIFTAYSLGVINGILGPILPALTIAQFLTLWFWGKALSSDKLAAFIQGIIDLGLDFMPASAKMIVGVLLIVLGLSDALNFYGLKDFLDRMTGGGHEP